MTDDEMKPEYDFSKGVRGKFFIPAEQICLPHYLDPELEQSLNRIAQRTGKSPDILLKILLANELNTLEKLAI